MEEIVLTATTNQPARIFIISEFLSSQQNSTGYFWEKIIYAIAPSNDSIHLITSSNIEDKSLPLMQDFSVKRIPALKYKNNFFFLRVLNEIYLSGRYFIYLAKNISKNDIVYCGTNPVFLILSLGLLKKIVRFKWILLVHDIFPDNLMATNKNADRFAPLLKTISALLVKCYAVTTSIIVIGRDMKLLIEDKVKSKTLDIEYIPNFIDLEEFLLKIHPAEAGRPQDEITFSFFGNIGKMQGVKNLLAAIQYSTATNARFLFVGSGTESFRVQRFIDQNPSKNVVLILGRTFDSGNEENYGDISIASLAGGMKGCAVPSKAYFSLAANKPILIIGDKGSELDLMIQEFPAIGWFCEADSSKKLAKLIDSISLQASQEKAYQPRDVIRNKYDYALIRKDYLRHYIRIKELVL